MNFRVESYPTLQLGSTSKLQKIVNEGGDMLEGSVFDFSRMGSFDLVEANELVSILVRITKKHSKVVDSLISQLENCKVDDREKTDQIEALVNKEIENWNTKIRKLGGVPKGMWLVDLDSGDGYYCWKFPETEIKYWHDYKTGYANRIDLAAAHQANKKIMKTYGETKNSDIV